jgi:O-antigen/teichoic acid export membrane protein
MAATSALAMLYKLAMPRALGAEALGQFYFAETFPFLFFALVPFGINTYIMRNLSGRPGEARAVLPSILVFEAVAGALACVALLLALLWRAPGDGAATLVVALMGIACLSIVLQQRILRPAFLALDAAAFVSRVELTTKGALAFAVLVSLAAAPDLRLIAGLHATAEAFAVGAYVIGAARRGWLTGPVRLATMRHVVVTSLPFCAVTVLLALGGNVDSALLSHAASAREIGLYAAANRLGGIVWIAVSIIASAISPMLGRLSHEAPQLYGPFLADAVRICCAIGLPITLGLSVAAPELARLLFGAEYADAWRPLVIYGGLALSVGFNLLAASSLSLKASGPSFALVVGASVPMAIALKSVGIRLGESLLGAGGAGTGLLIADGLSDVVSAAVMLYLTRGAVDQRRMYGPFLAALAPNVLVASLLLSGAPLSDLARGAIFVALPFYMAAVGLVRRGDAAWTLELLREWRAAKETSKRTSPLTAAAERAIEAHP